MSSAFYCYDANGNVTDLVGTNGQFLAQYQFDPYGNTIAKSGDLADVNPFRFSTKYLDTETGLYCYGYRYYLPEIGRWASRDPIGDESFRMLNTTKISIAEMISLPQQAVLYVFVGNAPVDIFDSNGLFWRQLGEWVWNMGRWYWRRIRPSPFPSPDPIPSPLPDPFDPTPLGDPTFFKCQLYLQKPHADQCPPCYECKYRCIEPGPGYHGSWFESHVVGIHDSCELSYGGWH